MCVCKEVANKQDKNAVNSNEYKVIPLKNCAVPNIADEWIMQICLVLIFNRSGIEKSQRIEGI